MHPIFHSELTGLDWSFLLIGHIIMFFSLAIRLDWSWIPLTEHDNLYGLKGNLYLDRVNSLEKFFQNSQTYD